MISTKEKIKKGQDSLHTPDLETFNFVLQTICDVEIFRLGKCYCSLRFTISPCDSRRYTCKRQWGASRAIFEFKQSLSRKVPSIVPVWDEFARLHNFKSKLMHDSSDTNTN